MRLENLPSPGLLSNAIGLRAAAARAISNVEVTAARTPGGLTSGANQLHVFFTACATAVAAMRDVTAPTVTARNQTTGEKVIRLTTSEGLDPSIVPAAAAFAISPARTITGIEVLGTSVRITYSGTTLVAGDSPTIGYTQPGTNALRDTAGNLLATFAPAAVTVA